MHTIMNQTVNPLLDIHVHNNELQKARMLIMKMSILYALLWSRKKTRGNRNMLSGYKGFTDLDPDIDG